MLEFSVGSNREMGMDAHFRPSRVLSTNAITQKGVVGWFSLSYVMSYLGFACEIGSRRPNLIKKGLMFVQRPYEQRVNVWSISLCYMVNIFLLHNYVVLEEPSLNLNEVLKEMLSGSSRDEVA